MGGNVCKELGIKPTKTIGTKELEELWKGYAKGSNTLTKEDAMKFLKQFATAIGVECNKGSAEKWFDRVQVNNTLDYDNFLRFFTLIVKENEESKVKLTSTLATKLNFSLDLPEEKKEDLESSKSISGSKDNKNNNNNNNNTYKIKCQGCKSKNIKQVLYKCRNCNDYHLCEKCEIKSDSIHNPDHCFIKIKSATQLANLPLPTTLKLTLYYYYLNGTGAELDLKREDSSQVIMISSDKTIRDLKEWVCGESYGGTDWGKSESLGKKWKDTVVKLFDKEEDRTLKEAGIKDGDVIVSHRPKRFPRYNSD